MSIETVNILVAGGFSVELEVKFADAEPDVGIYTSYPDDWRVIGFGGRYIKRGKKVPAFVERMLDAEPDLPTLIAEAL